MLITHIVRRSALHLAAAEGHVEVVSFLVKKGADVNSEDRWGNRPLRDAIQGKHTQVQQLKASYISSLRPRTSVAEGLIHQEL